MNICGYYNEWKRVYHLPKTIPENNFCAIQIIESPFQHTISIKNRFTLFICLYKMQQLIALQSLHGVSRIGKNGQAQKTRAHIKFKQVYIWCNTQMVKLFDADLFCVFNSNLFYTNRKKKSFVQDYLLYKFSPFTYARLCSTYSVLVYLSVWVEFWSFVI